MSVLQHRKLADPEVDGCANVGVKSTRAPLFVGVGMPCVADASGSPLGPLVPERLTPGTLSPPPPTEFCACLLLVPPSRSSTGFKNTPFIWRDRKSNPALSPAVVYPYTVTRQIEHLEILPFCGAPLASQSFLLRLCFFPVGWRRLLPRGQRNPGMHALIVVPARSRAH